jgi:RNA polymerase sigma factor (sigma-70 family)
MSIYTKEQVETLVQDNMGLVVSLAKSLHPPNHTEFEEYLQLGRIGLWKAIMKFDPTRGTKLSTIAWDYIRWEIIRYISKRQKEQRLMNSPYLIPYLEKTNERKHSYLMPAELSDLLPKTLTDTEKRTVQLRNEGHTFQEIGNHLGGYTKGWANTLFKSAIRKIQDANKQKTHIDGE